MKNSTLVYTLIALGIVTWLFFIITNLMLILSAIVLGMYLIGCIVSVMEYEDEIRYRDEDYCPPIDRKHNIFSIITKALDSLPPFIKKK